jgi:iron complex transport system ATP-binding protein
MDTARLDGRRLETLSGGERQRVWCAVVVAQQASLLLLDEPTTFLDVVHQLELLALVRRLTAELDRIIVMVLHDLNLAMRHAAGWSCCCGAVLEDAEPDRVLSGDALDRAFDVEVGVLLDPVTGEPACLPRLRTGPDGHRVARTPAGGRRGSASKDRHSVSQVEACGHPPASVAICGRTLSAPQPPRRSASRLVEPRARW